MATRRELAHINRENEKQQRELEELKVILEVSTGNFYVKATIEIKHLTRVVFSKARLSEIEQ